MAAEELAWECGDFDHRAVRTRLGSWNTDGRRGEARVRAADRFGRRFYPLHYHPSSCAIEPCLIQLVMQTAGL